MSSSHQPLELSPIGIGHSHGSLSIFSAPRAVITHVQWSISDVLGRPEKLNWQTQPLIAGTYRTHVSWSGNLGTGATLASVLRGWHYLHFEVYEAAQNGSDGSLFMFTPDLGLFRANIGPHGDIMINEHQIMSTISKNLRECDVLTELEKIIGKPWNDALEPFRRIEIEGVDEDAGRISV